MPKFFEPKMKSGSVEFPFDMGPYRRITFAKMCRLSIARSSNHPLNYFPFHDLGEEVVAFVVYNDDGGEVDDLYLADGFQSGLLTSHFDSSSNCSN